MPLPYQPWRAAMQPASFRGAGFHVDRGGQAGGRRGPTHEYPNRDTPWSEDLGRKARRWPITAYVIGPNYIPGRDALIAACEAEGPATLVHPTLGSMQVKCESYTVTETREHGGMATFEMAFVEAGSLTNFNVTASTQAASTAAATTLASAATTQLDAAMKQSLDAGTITQPVG